MKTNNIKSHGSQKQGVLMFSLDLQHGDWWKQRHLGRGVKTLGWSWIENKENVEKRLNILDNYCEKFAFEDCSSTWTEMKSKEVFKNGRQ